MLLAQVALVVWIPIAIFLLSRFPLRVGTAVAFLGGTLLLPAIGGFDFPLFPALSKPHFVSLGLLLGIGLFRSRSLARARVGSGIDLSLLLYLALAIATAYTNRDPIAARNGIRPGLALSDGVAMAISDLLLVVVPFVAGRVAYRSPKDLRTFHQIYVFAALAYSVLALFEMRFSPQLHRWIYGIHAQAFGQQMRFGGYRPMLFLGSGLSVALFFSTATILALSLMRGTSRQLWRFAASYLGVILVLCKSFASIAYGLIAAPLALLGTPRTLALVGVVLATLSFLFPIARFTGLFPVESVVSLSAQFNAERADSLEYRFSNEDVLIEHGRNRPWLGYGSYFGRMVVWNPKLRHDAIFDGFWIIQFASRGFLGFVFAWLPFVLSTWVTFWRLKFFPDRADRWALAGTALMVGVQSVDLLPNGLFTQIPYLAAGALAGSVSAWRIRSSQPAAAETRDDNTETKSRPASVKTSSLAKSLRRRSG